MLPLVLIALLLAAIAAIVGLVLLVHWAAEADSARARLRRPVLGGPCEVCGYDLRGQAERCPECGNRLPFGGNRRMAEATERLTLLTRAGRGDPPA